MHLMMSSDFLWTCVWFYFHDLWNSIKTAAKTSCLGRWWKRILQFASVANINHGPFRSGAWGKTKQTTHQQWHDNVTVEDEAFRDVARRQAALLGRPITDEREYDEWLVYAGRIRSCMECGPVCKFARWMSVEQVWDYYRPEIYVTRIILQEMKLEDAM